MESCRGRWGDGAREGAQPPLQPLRRVRLEFHSPDFVTSAKEGKEDPEETIVGELRRSWLLVPSSAREVNDLAWLIADKFHLKKTWRQGRLLLELDGFALPLAESIDIVRDDDIITVKKRSIESAVARKRSRDSTEPASSAKKPAVSTARSPNKVVKKKRKVVPMDEEKKPADKEGEHEQAKSTTSIADAKENGTKSVEKDSKRDENEDSDESSSSEEESSSSSEEESSSSEEESSSSEEDEEEKPQSSGGATTLEKHVEAAPQQQQQSSVTAPSQAPASAVTPLGKGHVRFGPDGEAQPAVSPSAQLPQHEWNAGRGRGRGLPHTQGPPLPPPAGRARGRGRGALPPAPDFGHSVDGGFGRGRGWAGPMGSPGRGRGHHGPGGPYGFVPSPLASGQPHAVQGPSPASLQQVAPFATHQGPYANDLSYASGFAEQPSQSSRSTNNYGGRDYRQAAPIYYSASLDWKKDTHPSYAPLPPVEPPRDYSSCKLFSDAGRSPRRGDVIAYQILQINDGGPGYSAHKEARVEDYDAASSTVMLRATKLSSVPLDGRFVASEEDRAALYETTVNLAWDQLVDVRLVA